MPKDTLDTSSGSSTVTKNSMRSSCSLLSATTSGNMVKGDKESTTHTRTTRSISFAFSEPTQKIDCPIFFFPAALFRLGASFAENFYGLKRLRAPRAVKPSKSSSIDDESIAAAAASAAIPSSIGSKKLDNRDIRKSLLFLVKCIDFQLSRSLFFLDRFCSLFAFQAIFFSQFLSPTHPFCL